MIGDMCPVCGLPVYGGGRICAHHPDTYGPNWAAGNKIMCDFFHRGVVPPRVADGTDDEQAIWWQEYTA